VPRQADVILVHDAARPLVSAPVIGRCIAAAAAGRSALAAVPVTDTIQQVDDDGVVVRTPDRALLRAAQTPQAFPAGVLREAHDRAAADGVSATDDAGLVARYGGIVHVVDGEVENLKVTTQLDMLLAAAILSSRT
jgi:2-C-methyl-D-erythritol 4-phosphate cytidylyltransferase